MQWHEGHGMWLAFTHAAANAVLRTRTLGRVWTPRWPDEPMPAFELIHVNSLLENEPPVHTRLRRLIAGASRAGTSSGCGRGSPRWPPAWPTTSPPPARRRPVDLIATYAEPLPVEVIAELLGVPESDRHLLRPWSNAIVKMYEYGVSRRAAGRSRDGRRATSSPTCASWSPSAAARPGDDLSRSLIAETDADGARLTEDELITTVHPAAQRRSRGHRQRRRQRGPRAAGRTRTSWQRLRRDAGL